MQLRIFTEPQQGATYAEVLAAAQATERLGFDGFFRSDHYLHFSGDGGPGPTDAWITLAGLARETATIRLGTLVSSATFRLPGPLAVSVAQVDAMSGGRVELGIGTGWFADEHRAYGIGFPPVAERFERLEEQLAILTGMWATPAGERFSFSGQHYALADCPALAKPVQHPHPPLIIGGWGTRRTPALAARYAAEYNLAFPGLEDFTTRVGHVRAACEAIGRDPAQLLTSVALTVCCGASAAELAAREARLGATLDHLRAHALIGSPDALVDAIGRFAQAGASRVYLQLLDLTDLDHLELLAAQVAPQVP